VAVRVAPVAPPTRLAVAWLAGGYALAIAVARLVETVHPLTDVLGGGATGLVVTLGGALALTAVSGSEQSRQPSAPGGRRRRPTVQWRHLRGPNIGPIACPGWGEPVHTN
jgi:hypothetical protein